jgi:thioredoxin 1
MGMNTEYADSEPGRSDIETLAGPAVIEFGTPWCGWCSAAQPMLATAFASYPHIPHIKVEDGKGRPLGRFFRVKLWPTLIFLRDGKEVTRLVRPGDAGAIGQALAQIDRGDPAS